jgi:hypothetical protein
LVTCTGTGTPVDAEAKVIALKLPIDEVFPTITEPCGIVPLAIVKVRLFERLVTIAWLPNVTAEPFGIPVQTVGAILISVSEV